MALALPFVSPIVDRTHGGREDDYTDIDDAAAWMRPPEASAVAAGEARAPWTCDDFRIGSRLGGGRYSNVFVAKEKQSGFTCALKIMKKRELRAKKKLQEQVRTEVAVQRALRHRHVVQLYAYFHDAERIYVVLEYCPGGQLFQYIAPGGLPEDVVRGYIQQIADAVRYLHASNILHRDIKPENILLDKRGCLRLADFGWAVEIGPAAGGRALLSGAPCPSAPAARRQTCCGTLDYMAPEMLDEAQTHSKPVDVWAVGILTHELLTGAPPFVDPHPHTTCQRILHEAYTPPQHLSSAARGFLVQMLQKDEAVRPTMEEAAQHPFVLG
eukprot:TRINITY_DN2570_c0_g1_i1.p1 TRINITY_DN2570_c0_g1~~TRINITY_DN2570_c0_g1_i1.p1  ORF type:complete len:327 (+),score=116.10 TRINITY_DN2570_c0_g1_i1:113-1093(+)